MQNPYQKRDPDNLPIVSSIPHIKKTFSNENFPNYPNPKTPSLYTLMTCVEEGGVFSYLPTGATFIQSSSKADSPIGMSRENHLARTMPNFIYIIRYARTMPKNIYITWRSESYARTMPIILYIIRSHPIRERIIYVARTMPKNIYITQ